MTIVGQHTVAEVRDLIRSKDDDLTKLKAGADAFMPTWQKADADAAGAWQKDWSALVSRYKDAKASAIAIIGAFGLNPLPENVIPAEGSYTGILRALQKKDGVVSPGDKQDLYSRLDVAGAKLGYSVIQPTAPDADLNASNALAKLDPTKKGSAAQWVLGGIGAILLLVLGVKVLK